MPPEASQAPTRRNDPCPCGSGLRFKECHGRLEGQAAPGLDALLGRALQHHQQGRIDEAERGYREVLSREPGHAVATHYLGMVDWARGDTAGAEQRLRASIAANAGIPDFHNNLAMLLQHLGRLEEAIAGFRRALEVDASWFEAHNNLGLALEEAADFDAAEAEYRSALAREPRFAAARQNLGRLLLARGRFAEGWEHYRWRLLAQGVARVPPDPAAPRLPGSLAGRRLALTGEQGIGDVLFFLRFAPELARRGARLAFRGDRRLHPLLERTGHFALGGLAEDADPGDAEPIAVGDLPWLLEANDPAAFPPPLALSALPDRLERWRARLPADAPVVALTWRSGVRSEGPTPTLLKEIPIAALGSALRGMRAAWVSIQRSPGAGEREALEQAIGAPVHDFSAMNDDLEDALAVLALVDLYAGTSNANTHLRAGLGLGQHVLVPDPPEWRWMLEATRSPWFAQARIYRPEGNKDWSAAFARLRRELA